MADIIPFNVSRKKSLQQVIEEYESPLTDDTEEALEGLKQHLVWKEYSFGKEDIEYLLGVIKGLRPDSKNSLNSHFAYLVIREHILSSVLFSLKNELRGVLDYCTDCNASFEEEDEAVEELLEKHGPERFYIQISVIGGYVGQVKYTLERFFDKNLDMEVYHYVNNSIAKVMNGPIIPDLIERVKELKRAKEDGYREVA